MNQITQNDFNSKVDDKIFELETKFLSSFSFIPKDERNEEMFKEIICSIAALEFSFKTRYTGLNAKTYHFLKGEYFNQKHTQELLKEFNLQPQNHNNNTQKVWSYDDIDGDAPISKFGVFCFTGTFVFALGLFLFMII